MLLKELLEIFINVTWTEIINLTIYRYNTEPMKVTVTYTKEDFKNWRNMRKEIINQFGEKEVLNFAYYDHDKNIMTISIIG